VNEVLSLDDVEATDRVLVGAKAAAIARMRASGFPAPGGFVVSVPAFRAFLAHNRLMPAHGDFLRPGAKTMLLAQLQEGVATAMIPPSTFSAVCAAYAGLGGRVAVRSSGVAEDSDLSSFAGAYVSFLDRVGEAEVLAALRECWRSAFSTRVTAYRLQHGLLDTDWAMGVIVQEMVVADKAGVMFTRDPFSAHSDSLLVEAVEGGCERIVGGAAADISLTIDRSNRHVVRREEKAGEGRFGMGAASLLNPRTIRRLPLLSRREIDLLINAGIALEKAFGGPQDVEWAFAGGELALLQTRPITAKPEWAAQ
jgi:pyruvate,water dikinase